METIFLVIALFAAVFALILSINQRKKHESAVALCTTDLADLKSEVSRLTVENNTLKLKLSQHGTLASLSEAQTNALRAHLVNIYRSINWSSAVLAGDAVAEAWKLGQQLDGTVK